MSRWAPVSGSGRSKPGGRVPCEDMGAMRNGTGVAQVIPQPSSQFHGKIHAMYLAVKKK